MHEEAAVRERTRFRASWLKARALRVPARIMCRECEWASGFGTMIPVVCVDRVDVAREAMTYTHVLPEKAVSEEIVPVSADARGAGESARLVDEAEDVKRDLWGQCTQEVAFEQGGDRRRKEEQFQGCAFLDERVQVLSSRSR